MTKTRNFTMCGAMVGIAFFFVAGCGGAGQKQNKDFFTSGSPEADQRADQRMAKSEQLTNGGSSGAQTAAPTAAKPAHAEEKKSLYQELGDEAGIAMIVDDFVPRVLADPRVNFTRQGVKEGGLTIHHFKSMAWEASAENVKKLKTHMIQFLSLVTGGPSKYDGMEMKAAHAGLHISNPEFDASLGDLKATLDKLQIPNTQQKELLAVVETTRPEIVEER